MSVKHLLILLNPLFFIKNTSQLLDLMQLCWLKDKMIQISLSLSVKMHYLKNKTLNSWWPSCFWIVTQMLGCAWNLLWIHLQGGYTTDGTFAAELSPFTNRHVKIMNKNPHSSVFQQWFQCSAPDAGTKHIQYARSEGSPDSIIGGDDGDFADLLSVGFDPADPPETLWSPQAFLPSVNQRKQSLLWVCWIWSALFESRVVAW